MARSRYHVGWGNDSYQMNRHINIDAGLRWEEQWYGGSVLNYLFNDNWSPRLGINCRSQGRSQNQVVLQLCAVPVGSAARCRHPAVGQRAGRYNLYFAPKTDASGNML